MDRLLAGQTGEEGETGYTGDILSGSEGRHGTQRSARRVRPGRRRARSHRCGPRAGGVTARCLHPGGRGAGGHAGFADPAAGGGARREAGQAAADDGHWPRGGDEHRGTPPGCGARPPPDPRPVPHPVRQLKITPHRVVITDLRRHFYAMCRFRRGRAPFSSTHAPRTRSPWPFAPRSRFWWRAASSTRASCSRPRRGVRRSEAMSKNQQVPGSSRAAPKGGGHDAAGHRGVPRLSRGAPSARGVGGPFETPHVT